MLEEKKAKRAARRARKAGQLQIEPAPMAQHPHMHHDQSSDSAQPAPPPETCVAFVFPGQGSQAVGMLKVRTCSWECQAT